MCRGDLTRGSRDQRFKRIGHNAGAGASAAALLAAAKAQILAKADLLYALDLLRRMALDIPPENAHPVPSKDVKPETLDI